MTQNINELKRQIVQMNVLLDSLKGKDRSAGEQAKQINTELDSLLYRYYKLLKCG
jgi:hypothetical protein